MFLVVKAMSTQQQLYEFQTLSVLAIVGATLS